MRIFRSSDAPVGPVDPATFLEVGTVLMHVITVPDWSPESVPKDFPASIGRSYVAIFEKAR
jgi:hypothetical protein